MTAAKDNQDDSKDREQSHQTLSMIPPSWRQKENGLLLASKEISNHVDMSGP